MVYVSPLIKSAENTDMINSNSGQDLKKIPLHSAATFFLPKRSNVPEMELP